MLSNKTVTKFLCSIMNKSTSQIISIFSAEICWKKEFNAAVDATNGQINC